MESEVTVSDQSLDPSAALKLAQTAREQAAARGVDAPWYAPIYGLGMGGMIASWALPIPCCWWA